MKIIEIHNSHSNLRCHGQNIFTTTHNFLERFPKEYRTCYDQNIKDLELFKVDELVDNEGVARYVNETNAIIYEKEYALGHEMFHMASTDRIANKQALNNKLGVEKGIVEGMTEYFHMQAYDLKEATTYFFHVFCVTMLDDIPDIFKSYFIPTDDTFFNGITDPRYIYSLLYSLDTYDAYYGKYSDSILANNRDKQVGLIVEKSIRNTINHLITIRLSLSSNCDELTNYSDRFMDLIGSGATARTLRILYPSYRDYAEQEIKRRIRRTM